MSYEHASDLIEYNTANWQSVNDIATRHPNNQIAWNTIVANNSEIYQTFESDDTNA